MPRVLALRALLLSTAILALPCGSAHAAAPLGDSFAAPVTLTGADVTVTNDTADATRETGEQWGAGTGSVWYEWTAADDGPVALDTEGSTFNTLLIVATGDTLGALTALAYNDDAEPGTTTSRTVFQAVAGTKYRILVDGSTSDAKGELTLSLRVGTPPANDNFANATVLPSERVAQAAGDTLGATAEAGEPLHYPYGQPRTSVWYSWTAPASGALTIRVDPATGLIPVIAAYTGDTLTALTRVQNEAQTFAWGEQHIRLRVEAGTTYRIALEIYGVPGEVKLSLDLVDPPLNDEFAKALPLAGALADAAGSTVGATQEPCEPIHDDNYYDPSVWFTWTAPASGGVTIDTTGSDFPTALGIYTGDALCSLTRVPVNRLTGPGVPAKRTFVATAGETYRIAVDGQNGRTGSYKLALRHSPPPVNDLLADATRLTGAAATITGTTLGATGEPGESNPDAETGASVWYSWTAPSTGATTVKLQNATFGGGVSVHTGTAIDSLTLVRRGSGETTFRAVEGTTYLIAIDGGTTGGHGDFELALKHDPAPANDDFAAATLLAGSSDSRTDTNVGATSEDGEGLSGYTFGSVWYSWTAASTGAVAIDTEGSSFDTALNVYGGDTLGALSYITSNNDVSWDRRTSRVSFRTIAGETYRIAVSSGGFTTGEIKLRLRHSTTPANDSFASALELPSAAAVTAAGVTLGASGESGEPAHYYYDQPRVSVWYAWTAPSSGSLTIKATADHQPVIAAYTGSTLTELERVRNQAQDWNGGPEQIRLRVEAGVTYHIAIDGRDSLGGEFSLSLQLIASPLNDDFANPEELTGLVADLVGDTLGATQELCEPIHDDNYYDPSVWFTWTATASGAVTLDSTGSDFPTVIGVYTGDKICELLRIPLSRFSAVGQPAIRGFRAVAGQTYRIAIDGAGGRMGNFKLALRHKPPPANDLLANAEELAGAVAHATGTNHGATAEAGEPGAENGATVWYRWTAPATGLARVDLSASDFAAGLSVYTGDEPGSLVRHGATDYYWGNYTFRAEAGQTYKIAVDGGSAPAQGNFTIALSSLPSPPNDDFADAVTLTGESGGVDGTTAGATLEPGESTYLGRTTVWYSWTAPRSGAMAFELQGSGLTGATVYRGDSLDSLVKLPGTGVFRATEGETYRIAVAAYPTVGHAAFRLSWRTLAAPPNDAFAAAIPLSGSTATQAGTTAGAGREDGEPAASGHYYEGSGATVWYSWTAPSTGLAGIRTTRGALTAYRGDSIGSLEALATAWSYDTAYFPVTEGTTYWLRVDGSDTTTDGSFTLSLTLVGAPPNDDFENAAELTDRASGTTTGASQQDGEPLFDTSRRGTVWYTWTPETSGTAVVTGPSYSHGLGIYTGDSLAALEHVAGSSYGSARFKVSAGTPYRIAISSTMTSYDQAFTVTTEVRPAPPNDDFANAVELAGESDSVTGSNVDASFEPGQPYEWTGSNMVWYRWTAPRTGRVTVDLGGTTFNATVSAYQGSSVGDLTRVTGNYDSGDLGRSRLTIEARKGATYHFAVNGYYGAEGAIQLGLSMTPAPANDEFAAAEPLSGEPLTVNGTNVGATHEPDEPLNATGGSVWYAWTAEESGYASLDFGDSGLMTVVAVYDGRAVGALNWVTSAAAYSRGTAIKLTFYANEGQTYRISVDGYSGDSGTFRMAITQAATPWTDPAPSGSPPPEQPSGNDPPSDQWANEPPPDEAQPPGPAGASGPPGGDQPPTTYQPPAPPSPPASPPTSTPLRLTTSFPKQRLGTVLTKGLVGDAICSSACDLEIVLTLDAATAKKARLTPSQFLAARVIAPNAGRTATRFVVRLPKGVRAKLAKIKTLPVTVRIVAGNAGGVAEQTKRLKLKR